MTTDTTPWYFIDTDGQPPLPGWYEVLYDGTDDEDEADFLYWDGDFWRFSPTGAQSGFGNYDTTGERWRGATTPNGGKYV